jgi:TonB family protein
MFLAWLTLLSQTPGKAIPMQAPIREGQPPAGPSLPAPALQALQNGSISGQVIDKDGVTPVQRARVVIDSFITQNGQIQFRESLTAMTGRDGRYSLSGVYIGRIRVTVITNNSTPVMIKGEVIGDELFVVGGIDTQVNFDLSKPGPVGPGSLMPRPLPPAPPHRIGGDVARSSLISTVPPVYPPLARERGVQGIVLLEGIINTDGTVQDLRVISGHPLLNDAAIEAVRLWRYRPQTLAGQQIPVITTINVDFTLP